MDVIEKYADVLKQSSLFQGTDEKEIQSMLVCMSATEKHYAKGESIYRIGEQITKMGLLLEGSIHIQREDYWGNLSILNQITPGNMIGEAYALPNSTPIVNNVIATEASTILFMDVKKLMTTCSSACVFHMKMIQNLLMVLAGKNRSFAQKLGHMSQRSTRDKLLSYLSEQSMLAESSEFDISFNRQQLADFLSVDRSAMSNELCKMRDEGILKFQKNHFVLL